MKNEHLILGTVIPRLTLIYSVLLEYSKTHPEYLSALNALNGGVTPAIPVFKERSVLDYALELDSHTTSEWFAASPNLSEEFKITGRRKDIHPQRRFQSVGCFIAGKTSLCSTSKSISIGFTQVVDDEARLSIAFISESLHTNGVSIFLHGNAKPVFLENFETFSQKGWEEILSIIDGTHDFAIGSWLQFNPSPTLPNILIKELGEPAPLPPVNTVNKNRIWSYIPMYTNSITNPLSAQGFLTLPKPNLIPLIDHVTIGATYFYTAYTTRWGGLTLIIIRNAAGLVVGISSASASITARGNLSSPIFKDGIPHKQEFDKGYVIFPLGGFLSTNFPTTYELKNLNYDTPMFHEPDIDSGTILQLNLSSGSQRIALILQLSMFPAIWDYIL